MAVNCLYVAAASTAASAVALQWWEASLLDASRDGDGGDRLETVLRSHVTVALLVNLAAHVFVVLVLALKTLFFVQLTSSETRKVLEHIINYVIYKGTFLPLVVPPNSQQIILWSTWLVLCSLKMFQSLARERLEQLNASPSVTPLKYFRVYSALLLVISTDLLWMKLCVGFCRSCNSKLFWLLLFEPLSIAFETLQSIMVYGFQLFDIWQQHLMDSGADYLDFQKSYKQAAGSFSEWRGNLIRNIGFVIDLISLLMSLGHYSMIFWLRGMAFHLVDAVLLLNLRALIVSFLKRIKTYIKLRKALSLLDGALPDATYDEICEYDDECAICRGPMARAKKLPCNHLFHLACLRSWLDQGLMDGYSCPTCRRPLFLSSQGHTRSTTAEVANVQLIAEQLNTGLNQQRVPGHEHPVEQQNPSDAIWRGAGLDSSWAPPWSSPGMDDPGSSSAVRSVELSGVQMMMRLFTYPLARLFGCKVICYTHYPTVSSDMVERVKQCSSMYNNNSRIAESIWLSRCKILYYTIFSWLYGLVGSCAHLVMVNSSWTRSHIINIWKIPERTKRVYPPCDTSALQMLPLERQAAPPILISVAQFRPEKAHGLQLEAFALALQKLDPDFPKPKLQFVGSCRNTEDLERLQKLKDRSTELHIDELVELHKDISYRDLVQLLGGAIAGLHSMSDEHFGISVVEYMAAGAIPIAHKSAGPMMDIVLDEDGHQTGFLASEKEEYAEAIVKVLRMPEPERQEMAAVARMRAQMFSEQRFHEDFTEAVRPILSATKD